MSILQYLFDGQTTGTAASTGNTGASQVTVTASAAITFDPAYGVRSTTGLKFVDTLTGTCVVRTLANGANNAMAFEGVCTAPASAPASDVTLMTMRWSGGRVLSLVWKTTGAIGLLDSANTPTTFAAAGVVALGAQFRVALVVGGNSTTAGTIDGHIYTASGTSALATLTHVANANLTANQIVGGDLGPTNTVTTIGWDDVQWNDGGTSEIGPITAASNTVAPISTFSNAGAWTNVGAAASLEAALADNLDTTWVQSPDNPTAAVLVERLAPLSTGQITSQHSIAATAPAPVLKCLVELIQGSAGSPAGGTVISSRLYNPVPTTETAVSWLLTTTESANATDRTNLFLRYTADLA